MSDVVHVAIEFDLEIPHHWADRVTLYGTAKEEKIAASLEVADPWELTDNAIDGSLNVTVTPKAERPADGAPAATAAG